MNRSESREEAFKLLFSLQIQKEYSLNEQILLFIEGVVMKKFQEFQGLT